MKKRLINTKRSKLYTVTMWAVAAALVVPGISMAQDVNWRTAEEVVIGSGQNVIVSGAAINKNLNDEGIPGESGKYISPISVRLEEGGSLTLNDGARLMHYRYKYENGNPVDTNSNIKGMDFVMNGGTLNLQASVNNSDGTGTTIDANKIVIKDGTVNITGEHGNESYLGGWNGIEIHGGTINMEGTDTKLFGGQNGAMKITSGTINMNGENAVIQFTKAESGDQITGGTINVNSTSATLSIGKAEVSMSGGQINVAGDKTLTIKNGTDTYAGITQTGGEINTAGTIRIGTNSKLTVDSGGTLRVTGSGQIGNQGKLAFNDGSVFEVSAERLDDDSSSSPVITGNGAEVDQNATLRIAGVEAGASYNLSSLGLDNWKGKLDTGSVMLNLTENAEGAYDVTVASATSVMPGISGRLGRLIEQGYAKNQISTNADGAGARFLGKVLDSGMDGAQQAKTIESAAKLAVVGGAPQMTWGIHQQSTNIMLNRTSLVSPKTAGMAVLDSETQTGASSGDKLNTGFALWAMPFYQHMEANGMKSGNYDLDLDSDLAGLALGADYTYNNTRVGIAFNAGTGDMTGSGDLNRTTNDIDFWGVGLYFGKAIDNIGIKADISYTSTSNDMKQNVVGMDALKSDVDSRALSVGVEGEYQIKTASVDVAPYIGIRYTDMEVDDYRVKSGGDTVMKGYAIDQKVWTFPVGVRLTKEIDNANGWQVKPSLDVAVIPAVGDTRADSRVQFVGVDGTANLTTRVMDNISYMGQAGIEFVKGDLGFSLNYNYQGSSNSDMHSLFANVRYEF